MEQLVCTRENHRGSKKITRSSSITKTTFNFYLPAKISLWSRLDHGGLVCHNVGLLSIQSMGKRNGKSSLIEFFGANLCLRSERRLLKVNWALELKEKWTWSIYAMILGMKNGFILWSGPEQFQRGLPSPFPTMGVELVHLSATHSMEENMELQSD